MFGSQLAARRRKGATTSHGTLLGLDFGAYSLKSARISAGQSGARLDQVRITPYEKPLTSTDAEANLDRMVVAIESARLGGSRWKPIPVACTLPFCMAQMRLIDAPNDNEADDDLILRELNAESNSGDREWLGDYWQTQSSGDNSEHTPLGIVGARRDWVQDLITCLEDQGLEPRVLDGSPFAIARALRMGESRHDEVAAALDIGFEGAFFVLLRRGVPLYFRLLRGCGTRGISEAIQHGLDLDERESHQFLKACSQAARRPSAASKTMLSTLHDLAALPLRRLQNELARTLDFAKRQVDFAELKRIVLFGGGSMLPGMVSTLEHWADIDFRLWTVPLDELSETHIDSLPLLAQAMALAEISVSV